MIRVKNPNYVDSIPDEYQEVEYLESTGTQYIDTGFVPNQDTRVTFDFAYVSSTNLGRLFGTRNTGEASNTQCFAFGTWGTSNIAHYIAYSGVYTSFGTIDTNRHTIDFNKNECSFDDIIVHTFTNETFSGYGSIYLFTYNTQTISDNAVAKVYSCKIYDNGSLIRNYIPCYRKSDNISGLYDLVNNVFYINAGTGTFLVGKDTNKKDVNIKPIHNGKILKNRYVGGKLVYGEPLMNYEYRFVTVGENGQSYYSTDEETWNPMTGATKTLNSVTYGNDRFVAVGDSGKSYYSTDGETWITMGTMPGSSLTGNNYYSVAYGNNHFVAVGDSGLICYSTDGETWTSATGQTTGVFAYKEVIYAMIIV